MKKLFNLSEEITFLNFGSFGATPKSILEKQIEFIREMEKDPVHFIVEKGPLLLEKSKIALGDFLHCNPEDLVFITNPTYGMNLIIKNLNLPPQSEVLTTNLEYGAMDYTWEYYAEIHHFKYVKSEISLPIKDKSSFLADFWKLYSEKTKAIFISHITSVTGLILPIEEIIHEARKRNLLIIIDGAHAPGQIPLNLTQLDPDFYVGACHKWMMNPKGSSFIYVKKSFQEQLDPLVISWGFAPENREKKHFQDYHQFNGTRDYTAFLTIPESIDFRKRYEWENLTQQAHHVGMNFLTQITQALNTKPLAPLDRDFYGQLFSFECPMRDPIELKNILYKEFRIQIPVMIQHEKLYIRYSMQPFNDLRDLERLKQSLLQIFR